MSQFTVIFDACVLYPAPLRDFLMWLSLRDLFRAKWSEQILDEMQTAILRNLDHVTEAQIQRTRSMMNGNVRDASVTGYEKLIPTLELPDENDRHVLAAAIRSGAQIILTFNLKDFPAEELNEFGVEAQHPDDFLEHLFDLHPGVILEVLKEWRANLKNPPLTSREVLDALQRQSLPKFVNNLLEYETLF